MVEMVQKEQRRSVARDNQQKVLEWLTSSVVCLDNDINEQRNHLCKNKLIH